MQIYAYNMKVIVERDGQRTKMSRPGARIEIEKVK